MSDSKRKLIIMVIIISIALLFFLAINLLSSSQKESKRNNSSELFSLLDTTPTPYPLPDQVYSSSTLVTTLWRQLFGKKNNAADPSVIIEGSKKQFTTEHFELYVEDDLLTIDTQWWQRGSTEVFEYVSHKLDETFEERIRVVIVKPLKERCGPRGKTVFEPEPIIMLYADNTTSRDQLLAVLAHELGHVFIHQKYKNLSDVALSEGMATWAAGDYWKAWKGKDFDLYVKGLLRENRYLPLYQNYDLANAYDQKNPDCITNRDELLAEFASFLDYLMREYGLDKLEALFETRQPEIINNERINYPPDYKEVYGLELNQLEHNWMKHLLATSQ